MTLEAWIRWGRAVCYPGSLLYTDDLQYAWHWWLIQWVSDAAEVVNDDDAERDLGGEG